MPHLILPAVALALVLAVPADAAEKVTKFDRFELWNDCRPMDLIVERLRKDAEIGLTKDAITIAVRSRLRAARLYDAGARNWLYVNVNVARGIHNISIRYEKWVRDAASGEESLATTWSTGGIGRHNQNSGFILSSVSQYVDKFIDEYLRVNADSCQKSN